MYTHTLLDGIF